jgi:hypothetical protein
MGIPRSKWVNSLDPKGVYKPAESWLRMILVLLCYWWYGSYE